ncbi:uncharacterized protein FOBCDRAFT_204029 [Fusarium oxysporum Fo47]|uniref:uncharacterized protein n=1 Tax=Fusarium oxysporum Fo47 TaxID=660027 RepID=UPI0015994B95|nr:uncharacterized protein FOBCDRAFT_204029 [Fusarium oxysporum Fo47]QKD56998.1 hypothetical protein FOBCDRAFT_204029 [Fusarium oxysporum Fo47]
MAHSFTWRLKILYPSEAEFDYEYYTTKHMPMFEQAAGTVLLNWNVVKLVGDNVPFQIQTTFTFSSSEGFDAIMAGPWGEKLFADIKNFSSMDPLIMKHGERLEKKDIALEY